MIFYNRRKPSQLSQKKELDSRPSFNSDSILYQNQGSCETRFLRNKALIFAGPLRQFFLRESRIILLQSSFPHPLKRQVRF